MDWKKIEKIKELKTDDPAAFIVANDGQLTTEIVNEWLRTMLPSWEMFYSELSTDPKHALEGHLRGPSPPQAYILRRMRDKGHRIAPVRGMFRWIGGSDKILHRPGIKIMLEKGWLRIGSSAIYGLEYILEPTEAGMAALANYELDREDRPYP